VQARCRPRRQQAVTVAVPTAAARDRGDEEASGGGCGAAMEKVILRGCACG